MSSEKYTINKTQSITFLRNNILKNICNIRQKETLEFIFCEFEKFNFDLVTIYLEISNNIYFDFSFEIKQEYIIWIEIYDYEQIISICGLEKRLYEENIYEKMTISDIFLYYKYIFYGMYETQEKWENGKVVWKQIKALEERIEFNYSKSSFTLFRRKEKKKEDVELKIYPGINLYSKTMSSKDFFKLYLPALEKAIDNNTKPEIYYSKENGINYDIIVFEECNILKYPILSLVSFYCNALSQNQKEIFGESIASYKNRILNEIEKLKQEYKIS